MNREEIFTEIERLQNQCSMLRKLQENAGYQWMMEQIQTHYVMKTMELVKPPSDIVDEQSRTYIAGEARALLYLTDLVSQSLKGQESSLKALQQSVENNDDFEENI